MGVSTYGIPDAKCIGDIGAQAKAVRARLLASCEPQNMLCRESEFAAVRKFWMDCVTHSKPGALYLSGKPGTGMRVEYLVRNIR